MTTTAALEVHDLTKTYGDGASTVRAFAGRLHVSEKAVAKHINSLFTKLDLPIAADDNRRVLAVLAYLDLGPS